MTRIVSGLQPTGQLHLGNYFGFVNGLQACSEKKRAKQEAYLFVADLHAITVRKQQAIAEQSRYVAAAIMACLDDYQPEANIFIQSQVHQHAEFAWFLNCLTPLGWLNRMHQFKTKAGKEQAEASAGLYTYPCLMAADILLYQADKVPVGEDQKQHVELACYLAGALKNIASASNFRVPQVVTASLGGRIMSLRDASNKMSKSDRSDYSRINLTDSDQAIVSKIKKAKTDAARLPQTIEELENRAEVGNLYSLLSLTSQTPITELVASYAGLGTSSLKADLADALIVKFTPIRAKINGLLSEEKELKARLEQGRRAATKRAAQTLQQVRQIFHLLPLQAD